MGIKDYILKNQSPWGSSPSGGRNGSGTGSGSRKEPPSLDDLRVRLEKRGSDSTDRIKRRLQRIEFELSHKSNFDFNIVNDKLDVATSQILEIIKNKTKGVSYVT